MERGTQRKIAVVGLVIIALIAGALVTNFFCNTKTVSSECKVIPTVQPTVVPTLENKTPKSTVVPTVVPTVTPREKCDIGIFSDIPWEKISEPMRLEELALQIEKDPIKEWSPGASKVVAYKIRGYKKRIGQEVSVSGVFSRFYYSENGRIHSLENVARYVNDDFKVYRSFLNGKGNEKLEIAIIYKGESVVGVGYGTCVNLDYITPNSGGDGGDSDGDSDGGPGPDPDGGGGPGPDPAI
ncbi:MAG: hypothetical protein WC998_03285 [Candidatus Paceibacterota bacterium]|jgi:hypothetical protein